VGDETSIQSLARSYGFMSYLKDHFPDIDVHSVQYDNADKKISSKLFDSLFQEHQNIGGAVVFDTRAYLISEYLKECGMGVKLIGYGTDKKNIADLKEGYISFLISERPEYQGYIAIRTILEHLLYNKSVEVEHYTPIDILMKETIDFYRID
jgi:LacI family transcriptional regulator